MRVGRFTCYAIVVWSLFLAGATSGQAPAKATAKPITVYQDPG